VFDASVDILLFVRIIVTGALGHIGSAFIRNSLFLHADVELVLVDDFSTQRFASVFCLDGPKYSLIEGTVKQVLTPELAASADAVVHLAAIADPGLSTVRPDEVYEHNFSNTKHAIATCLTTNVPLVFPSSTSIYGGKNPAIREADEAPQPHTPYARCKVAEEEAIRTAFLAGLSGAILRFGTIFGTSPGMRFHTAVNRFCWQATIGRPISVYRTALHQLRPYLAVEDASNALAHTVLNNCFHQSSVNISTCNTTVASILEEIRVIMPNILVSEIDSAAMNDHSFGVSTERAKKLGYVFDGNMARGIRETMELLAGIRVS
jgi:nucleoside-diphosphate-sugar epimerase